MLWHLVLQLALHRYRLQSKNVQYLHMLARSCSDGREEQRVQPAAGTPRLKQRQVPLSATPFLAPPSPPTPCWPSIWVNPPRFYVIAPCRECSLAFFLLHNYWPAVYPSVDWICAARCACSHLFALFIWNQIVLLMLICTAVLAGATACNLSDTRACRWWTAWALLSCWRSFSKE